MEERPSPDLETFARKFRLKYGREMTPDERHFYQLTKRLLDDLPEADAKEDDEAA